MSSAEFSPQRVNIPIPHSTLQILYLKAAFGPLIKMPTKVYILVWVGAPLDYTKYRHTALFFEFPDGSKCVLHIEEAPGIFEFEPLEDYDPDQSQRLAKKLFVVEIPDSVQESSIREVVSETPVKNERENSDWNCQNWVGDALTRMVQNGFLSFSQRESAVNQMVDVLLEAKN